MNHLSVLCSEQYESKASRLELLYHFETFENSEFMNRLHLHWSYVQSLSYFGANEKAKQY